MIVYKFKNNQVVEVECDEMRYPLKDKDGDTIYINTHFLTPNEAYEKAIKDLEAGISSFTRSIINLREQEKIVQNELVNDSIILYKLKEELENLL